jgi:hypothetical protein
MQLLWCLPTQVGNWFVAKEITVPPENGVSNSYLKTVLGEKRIK